MKPVLHFTPAKGWLNDPNGLVEHRGVHHLFFQHNPHELRMNDMCWGHATSTDLLTWTEQPVALSPGPGGSYDGDGCWSGCAVHHDDGVLVVYSGNNDGVQLPCVATSLDDDLIVWEKSGSNPVIANRPPIAGLTEMRDHSVRHDGQRWRQVLAAGAAGHGLLVGYSSADLVDWSWDGIVLQAADADLPGRIWECPDVFEAGGLAVAIISLIEDASSPGRVIWVTGPIDGARIEPTRWGLLDHGDRFYAPQSYTDSTGRRVMFGWLLTQLDPAALGQENIGVASLPRVLSVVDGVLHQRPAAEIEGCRAEPVQLSCSASGSDFHVELPPTSAVEVQVASGSTRDLMGVTVRFDRGDAVMTVDLGRFTVAERILGAPQPTPGGYLPLTATLIFDCGIVEVFLDDGRAAAFTDARLDVVQSVRVTGSADTNLRVTVWPLS